MKPKLLTYSLIAIVLAGCQPASDGAIASTPNPTSSTSPTTGSNPAPEPEAKPGFKNVVLTDDESTKAPKNSFTPNTAKIFIFWDLEKVPSGSKLKGTWICEKSKAIPPNYKIDEATVDVGTIDNSGNFSISKPTKGWPIGDYRVELWWDANKAQEVKFKIAK